VETTALYFLTRKQGVKEVRRSVSEVESTRRKKLDNQQNANCGDLSLESVTLYENSARSDRLSQESA